jgi:hypothetical protein
MNRSPHPASSAPGWRVSSRTGLLGAALAGCAGLLVAACGGSSSSNASAGPAVALTPFRGPGFTVGLPTKPKRVTLTVQADGKTLKVRLYLVKTPTAVFEVGEIHAVLPAGSFSGQVVRSAGKTPTETTTTYAGFPATDERVAGIAGMNAALFLREVRATSRTLLLLYFTVGSEPSRPPASEVAFFSSLVLR